MTKAIVDQTLADTIESLSASNETLATKATLLQKENRYLRRINRVEPRVRIAQRAYAGALKMATLHIAGYMVGRKACRAAGISERTFFAARALCKMARIHDGNGFTTTDGALIEQRLANALASAMAQPEALIARMPSSRRPTNV